MRVHVLRLRAFAFFLSGRFCNVLAAQMQWVANGWYLYDLTGDPMTLGWAGLASFVPIALLTLPAGALPNPGARPPVPALAPLLPAPAGAPLPRPRPVHTPVRPPVHSALPPPR